MSTITHKTATASGGASGDSPYVISVTAPANQALLAIAVLGDGNGSTTASPSGVWPTWALVDSHWDTPTGIGLWLFEGRGTPSAGDITTTISGGSWTEGFFYTIIVSEVASANTSDLAINGVSASGTGTTAAVTLGAFSGGSNATFSVLLCANGRTITAGTGFTELYETNNALNIGWTAQTQWNSGNDTSVDATLSSSDDWIILGCEIQEPAGGGGLRRKGSLGLLGVGR